MHLDESLDETEAEAHSAFAELELARGVVHRVEPGKERFKHVGPDVGGDPDPRIGYFEPNAIPRFGTYRFPLEMEIQTPDGKKVRANVEVPAQPKTTLTLDPQVGGVSAMTFDPDVKVLGVFSGR